MLFKIEEDKATYFKLHPILREILSKIDSVSTTLFDKEIFITSTYRPKGEDSGVHAVWRGTDLRTVDYYTKNQIDILMFILNNLYVYDISRPQYQVALYHKVEGSAYHIHLQVHDNTVVNI